MPFLISALIAILVMIVINHGFMVDLHNNGATRNEICKQTNFGLLCCAVLLILCMGYHANSCEPKSTIEPLPEQPEQPEVTIDE